MAISKTFEFVASDVSRGCRQAGSNTTLTGMRDKQHRQNKENEKKHKPEHPRHGSDGFNSDAAGKVLVRPMRRFMGTQGTNASFIRSAIA